MNKIKDRKIVVINQAVNHLTICYCNAFAERFEDVSLITSNIHEQGEPLNKNIKISWINKWAEHPTLKKMFSYIIACLWIYWLLITRYRKHEVFFLSVPPMAYLLNLVVWHKFSMLIWDIYPDIFKVTGMSEKHPVYKVWVWLNKKSFNKADKIFTIGDKLADLLAQYVDRNKIIVRPIWSILSKDQKVEKSKNIFIEKHNLQDKFIVQYSGNIGLTHKAELMVDLAERLQDQDQILFQIIGRGPRRAHLEKMVEEKKLPNCQFLPFQSDDMFPLSLSAADIGVAVLSEATPKASVPAKSYNLMAYGIPALYIAANDSQLSDYAQKFGHARCFTESKLDKAAEYILELYSDKELRNKYGQNAEKASGLFTRVNADKLVDSYLKDDVG